jgi:hypothetical protein
MNRKSQKRQSAVKDYVTVAFAEDMDVAREYQKILEEHQIPTVVKNQGRSEDGTSLGIAMMVPEEFLDEAYALISEEASFDDFFDAAFGEHHYDQHDPMLYDDFSDEDEVY